MMTDEEFLKIYNDHVKLQVLEGWKDISMDYHLGYLHGMQWLFDKIKRENDKKNGQQPCGNN
jgi:hypothetical protein